MLTEYKIGDTVITVVRGDITRTQAEAIVNPANSKLMMGGGVAGEIRRTAGPAIEKESLQRAPIRVGEAIVTKAGKLAARYVIHAPTKPLPAMNTDLESVQKATSWSGGSPRQRGSSNHGRRYQTTSVRRNEPKAHLSSIN